MADGRSDAQFGAQERRTKFSDQFLAGIRLVAIPSRKIAVETRDMPRPVTLMPISA
jgi:hypothetical protein